MRERYTDRDGHIEGTIQTQRWTHRRDYRDRDGHTGDTIQRQRNSDTARKKQIHIEGERARDTETEMGTSETLYRDRDGHIGETVIFRGRETQRQGERDTHTQEERGPERQRCTHRRYYTGTEMDAQEALYRDRDGHIGDTIQAQRRTHRRHYTETEMDA